MPRFSIFRHDTATTPQIGYSWYNNGQFIHQDCSFGPPIPCKIVLSDGTVIAPEATNLLLANGREVWCYVEYIKGADPVTGSPYYDSFGRNRLNTFPAAISPEGDIWITPFTNLDATLLMHDGTEIPLGLVDAWGPQLLSGGRRLWMQGYQVQSNFEMKGHPVAEGCYGVRCAEDGTALYQMLGGALVLGGHIIAPPSNNYNNPDVILIDGTYWVTYALTTADIPIPDPLHFTQAELDALPLAGEAPTAPPPFVFEKFNHNVLITPFKAADSGCPDVFTLGTYSEDVAPALPEGRLLVAHDAIEPWVIPGNLRPYDMIGWEFYRVPEETLAQSAARWRTQTLANLAQWPGDCFVIPMFYTQYRWTVQEVLDGLDFLVDLVNLSPRIKVVAPFSYDRLNGIKYVPGLQPPFESLKQATPGAPVLIPVTPPDPPDPGPTPIPPPATPYPPATHYHEAKMITLFKDINYAGGSLDLSADNADLRGPGWNDAASSVKVPAGSTVTLYEHINYAGRSLVLNADAPDLRAFAGPGADGTWNDAASSAKLTAGSLRLKDGDKYVECVGTTIILANTKTDNGKVTITKHDDKRYDAVFSKTVLSVQNDGSLQSRPLGTYGPFESFAATTQPDPDAKISFLFRSDGTKVIGPVLQVVEE